MKRVVRLIVLFVLALPVVPFLPLYLERTMLRSFRTGSAGQDRLGLESNFAERLLVELQLHGSRTKPGRVADAGHRAGDSLRITVCHRGRSDSCVAKARKRKTSPS